jgi:HD superfamily phosphohydrolase
LAAALLHDVGHGPHSHVFEEVAASLKQQQSHESYTQQIIEETDIKNILRKHVVFVETKKFFTTEAGYDAYTRIISSQMDCDRLDFLVRDRYYTGIRSAAIDLAWLFDSLRIEEVPIDPVRQIRAYSFVVLPKGISVIEEFVLSYMKMYQNVYFHKTTRAVQHMVADIIKIAVSNELSSNKRIKAHPIVKFFKSKRNRTLDNYLCLDDSSIMSLLRDLADQKLGYASKLAQRYFQRDTYKCVELPTYGSGEIRKSAATKFIERLQNSNIEFFDDRVPAKDYKQYDVMDENYLKNILVKKDNEYEPLGWNSEIVKNPPSKKIRLYFKTDKDRSRAIKFLPSALA